MEGHEKAHLLTDLMLILQIQNPRDDSGDIIARRRGLYIPKNKTQG